jgi:4-hydroxythreonine-4-phosphate dehydrogenase
VNVTDLPRIAITMGDPAGIGPEVTLRAIDDPAVAHLARYVIVGDAGLLRETAAQIGLPPPELVVADARELPADAAYAVLDRRSLDPSSFVAGQVSAACGRAAAGYIEEAVRLCLHGTTDAMTTGPVNKEAVTRAGIPFTGHTEYIADLCGVAETRMLLVNDRLRVVHVTTHCSLRQACLVTTPRILTTLTLGHAAMRRLGIQQPRLAVCGLNPHAGENGLFGSEDREIILPAVEAARAQGIDCAGPFAADTLFLKAVDGGYDLVTAMYHDQGHIPMKLLDFAQTVNVSLGLPILRTSVDHGTAFDIVGQNRADAKSMKAALRLAVTMAQHAKAERSEH